MVNTRSNKGQKTDEKLVNQKVMRVAEIDLETPEQSIDERERNTTESTPMPNAEEPGSKTIEFSTTGNGDEATNNTPETIMDESQTKRASFTGRLAAIVGMQSKEKEEVTTVTEKSKTFGTVSTITQRLTRGKSKPLRRERVTKTGNRQKQKYH